MSKKQNIVLGASITAGLAGILTSLLLSNKSNSSWTDGVSSLIPEKENNHEKFFIGSIAGGLAGVLISMLFAPQAGKDLVNNILRHLRSAEKKVVRAYKPVSKIKRKAKKKLAKVVAPKNTKPKKAPRKKRVAKKQDAPIKDSVVDIASEAV